MECTYYANRSVAVCQYLPLFGEYTPSNIEFYTLIKVATDLIKVFSIYERPFL